MRVHPAFRNLVSRLPSLLVAGMAHAASVALLALSIWGIPAYRNRHEGNSLLYLLPPLTIHIMYCGIQMTLTFSKMSLDDQAKLLRVQTLQIRELRTSWNVGNRSKFGYEKELIVGCTMIGIYSNYVSR